MRVSMLFKPSSPVRFSYAILAREMGVTVAEVEKLLNGETVGEETARRFVYYFGADEAVKMIDWAAIGKENPLNEG